MMLPLSVWGPRIAVVGLACWLASMFLSWSSLQPPEPLLTGLEVLGGVCLLLGFIGWRRAAIRAGYQRPLLAQIVVFSQPLVARLVLVGSVMLVGIGLAGDHISVAALVFAVMFLIVGLSLAASDETDRRVTAPDPSRNGDH